jgi:hypothetical protein
VGCLTGEKEEIMTLSYEAKLVSGVSLLAVPTVMFGGWTLLGLLTQGTAGSDPGGLTLDETQRALWRAGHAHAGVWLILSLVIQVLLDSARLSSALKWLARISAPVAAVAMSGGFFGLAFLPGFRWLLYLGVLSMVVAVALSGVGLLRNLRTHTGNTQRVGSAGHIAAASRPPGHGSSEALD